MYTHCGDVKVCVGQVNFGCRAQFARPLLQAKALSALYQSITSELGK